MSVVFPNLSAFLILKNPPLTNRGEAMPCHRGAMANAKKSNNTGCNNTVGQRDENDESIKQIQLNLSEYQPVVVLIANSIEKTEDSRSESSGGGGGESIDDGDTICYSGAISINTVGGRVDWRSNSTGCKVRPTSARPSAPNEREDSGRGLPDMPRHSNSSLAG